MSLGCTVKELSKRIDPEEWNYWIAYSSLEPFGPNRDDLRAGAVASACVNVWGGKTRASDFFPTLKTRREASWQSVEAWLMSLPRTNEIPGIGGQLPAAGDPA